MAKWIIDPDHSTATFSIRHMMIAYVWGHFCKIRGTVNFDPLDMYDSSIELSIDVSGIYTGIQKRDDHLKSPDFFDIDNYPFIMFTSPGYIQ